MIFRRWLVVPASFHFTKLAVVVEDEGRDGIPPDDIASRRAFGSRSKIEPDLPTQAQDLVARSLRRNIAAVAHRLRFHRTSAARQQPPRIAVRKGNQDFVFRFGRDE